MAESQYSRELGEGIMDAPTPDDSGVRPPSRSAAVKRVIDAWEPDEFAELVDQMRPIEFEPEVLPEEETLREANDKVKDEVENLISSWTVQPSQVMKSAMYVVATYAKEDHVWSASNDILATRVIDLLCGESFRAHKDGVYLYGNGDWAFVEEIKYPYIRMVLAILGCSAKQRPAKR